MRLTATPSFSAAQPARRVEIAQRLAAQEIADPAVDVRRLAGDAEQRLAVRAGFRPNGAAHARPVHDAMLDTTQRQIVPSTNGAASGSRRSRAAIQPPCFCANSLASRTLPRGGMVRMTSRVAAWMRSV